MPLGGGSKGLEAQRPVAMYIRAALNGEPTEMSPQEHVGDRPWAKATSSRSAPRFTSPCCNHLETQHEKQEEQRTRPARINCASVSYIREVGELHGVLVRSTVI